ncbi:MAG: manganese-binding transcriptional regulator MntR [Planctomycetaceae bacterium]
MSVRKITTRSHQRTRQDHSTELAEDYVEAIAEMTAGDAVCRVVDLARRFAVSHVTVNRAVARLERDGLVSTQPYAPVELTAKGRRMATAARERHEVVYAFLKALGVSDETAAVDAEGIEHHVSPETLKLMEHFATRNARNTAS